MANTNVPEEVKAIAQELWPESYEKQAVNYEHVDADENGPERWLLKETLGDDRAHAFRDRDGRWTEYL